MREAYGLENEDLLWAGIAFSGGIAGQQQAACGALSAAAIALGLHHKPASGDREKAEKARRAALDDAAELVKDFIRKYGEASCIGLTGVDLSNEEARKKAIESGLFEQKCDMQALFVIKKLYELEEKRRANP